MRMGRRTEEAAVSGESKIASVMKNPIFQGDIKNGTQGGFFRMDTASSRLLFAKHEFMIKAGYALQGGTRWTC